ncbi:hypothetical protein PRBRB14_14810 [Hallella multisaccharivorax DSM 17128]|nr:hypothetical protein PRBRB14_14810 [Hallella multisaccharivorax DSM 17128]
MKNFSFVIVFLNSATLGLTIISFGQQLVAQDFAMSQNLLALVLQNQAANSAIDVANLQIKSEKLTPFGDIFSIMDCNVCPWKT